MVISLVTAKGGTGKTTIALAAAAWLARGSAPVALLDADPQRTAGVWASLREEIPFTVAAATDPDAIETAIAQLAGEHRYVIVDSPPTASVTSRAIVLASDLVLVPVEASGASNWAVATTADQLREARKFQDVRAALVISRHLPRALLTTAIRERLAEHGLLVLRSGIAQRVAWAEALTMGKTIFEWAPRSRAATELDQLMKELLDAFEERLVEPDTPA